MSGDGKVVKVSQLIQTRHSNTTENLQLLLLAFRSLLLRFVLIRKRLVLLLARPFGGVVFCLFLNLVFLGIVSPRCSFDALR